jgi:hypothetical protein
VKAAGQAPITIENKVDDELLPDDFEVIYYIIS